MSHVFRAGKLFEFVAVSHFACLVHVQKYAKQVLALLDDIIALAPPKSGSQGQIFKLWGTSTPDRRANRIDPPDGIKIIPFGYGDTKTKNRKYKDR